MKKLKGLTASIHETGGIESDLELQQPIIAAFDAGIPQHLAQLVPHWTLLTEHVIRHGDEEAVDGDTLFGVPAAPLAEIGDEKIKGALEHDFAIGQVFGRSFCQKCELRIHYLAKNEKTEKKRKTENGRDFVIF